MDAPLDPLGVLRCLGAKWDASAPDREDGAAGAREYCRALVVEARGEVRRGTLTDGGALGGGPSPPSSLPCRTSPALSGSTTILLDDDRPLLDLPDRKAALNELRACALSDGRACWPGRPCATESGWSGSPEPDGVSVEAGPG